MDRASLLFTLAVGLSLVTRTKTQIENLTPEQVGQGVLLVDLL